MISAAHGPANKALKAYRRRWYIECLFGDGKTGGLNMEDTRLKRPTKFDTLLIVITPAMAWAYASVTTAEGTRVINNPRPRIPVQIMVSSRLRPSEKVGPSQAG